MHALDLSAAVEPGRRVTVGPSQRGAERDRQATQTDTWMAEAQRKEGRHIIPDPPSSRDHLSPGPGQYPEHYASRIHSPEGRLRDLHLTDTHSQYDHQATGRPPDVKWLAALLALTDRQMD